jgi:hypothetical protein
MSHTESTLELGVQVLIFREGESWIAQGLNYDITGHGQSLNDVIRNFWETFACQIVVDLTHGDKPLANIKPAPKYYWQKLQQERRAKRFVEKQTFSSPNGIPAAFMINAAADLDIAA